MPVSSLQAAIIAAIASIVALVVGFGIIDESTAGQITAAAGTLVGLGFLIANSIIHHGIPGDPNSALNEIHKEAKANAEGLAADGVDKAPEA